MTVLADIGGTYVRFAQSNGIEISAIEKYEASRFPDIQSALNQYCEDQNIKPGGALRIATAGFEDNGLWKFVNLNKWEMDPEALKSAGWGLEIIINDFEAATHVLPHLNEGEQNIFKSANGASQTLCLLGPGTGLGLGFYHKGKTPPVQKTHGGHMPVAAQTDEQWNIIQKLGAKVFEDIVSGPGLQKLRDATDEQTALKLFHEFFALAAANAVVTNHAYGGLYLTGGVLESLIEDKLFDVQYFESCFVLDVAASVKRDLNATPIIYITDPYPALKGLLHA